MLVQEIMTSDPVCCMRDLPLKDVARLMVENDCGGIPVVDDFESVRPIGMITDRDIACRVVAKDQNPLELTVGDCMTEPCVTLEQNASVESVLRGFRRESDPARRDRRSRRAVLRHRRAGRPRRVGTRSSGGRGGALRFGADRYAVQPLIGSDERSRTRSPGSKSAVQLSLGPCR